MRTRRVVASLFVLVAAVALVAVGGVAVADVVDGDGADETEQSMGAEMTAFMQSSSVDASDATDRGMYNAALESAADDERRAVVVDRTTQLERQYERLERQYERVQANDEMNPVARHAQLTRIAAQLSTLDESVEETTEHADAVGVDTDALETLRENAHELTGPEVAAIATSLAGIEPPGLENGPPGQTDDGTGLPAHAGEPPESSDSPPDDDDGE